MNLIGYRFNRLTVIEKTEKRKNNGIVWKCKCDCGNTCEVITSSLRNGRVKSCGCLNKILQQEKYKNLIGQKIGRLTVIEKTEKRTSNRCIIWKCKCDCGNICEVASDRLTSKYYGTKSCGCLQKEKTKHNNCNNGFNLIGQKFGKLTILKLLDNKEERTYLCKCDCGNKCEAKSKYLLNGHKASCGCLTRSKGEYIIKELLKNNNIYFIEQYHIDSCRFPDTQYYAYFDFYINNKYIIEYDGEQHFNKQCFNNIISRNAEIEFQKTQEHDKFKNNWCKSNNIPIIRIPYYHLKNLKLKDLLLESSNFII